MHIGKNTESHYYFTTNGIKKEIEVSKMEKEELGVCMNAPPIGPRQLFHGKVYCAKHAK